MKQFSRRIFSVALCATLASQLLTGCASKDNARNTSTDTSAPEKITYPLCTDGSLSLTIWKRFGGSKYLKSDAENEAVQALMKATGVNLKFIHPAAGQATESFNLMVVSDNVADIMVDHAYTGGTIKGIDDGVFQELTNLVPKYMPNYNKILKDDFEFRRETTAEDGRIFSLFSYTDVGNGAVKDDKRVQAEWSRMQLRGDWLQEFGMDVPKTLDQYEAYFQKVLEKKPGVAPFTLASSGLNKQILGAYDLDNDFYIKKDGKVAWPEIQPEFKDYLTKMNDWYKKGYISQDFTSANPSKLFAASKTACYLDASNSAYNAGKSLNFKPTTAPYPRLQDGQQIRNGYFNWPETIDDKTTISAKSKHIKEALEFMDFSFDKENYKILAYGPKGVSWNPGPNGQPVYTDHMLKNPTVPIGDVDYVLRLHTGLSRYRDDDAVSMPGNIADPGMLAYLNKWNDDPKVDHSAVFPKMIINADDNEKKSEIMKDVNTYANEMILKFIVGAEPLSNYDKYVQTIKGMNIDQATSIMQKAYESYTNRKK